jgi:ABC-type antimicrobial peptide transport system permease subunit
MNFFVQVWQIVVKYYPYLLKGIGMTLLISLVGTLIGLVIGLALGIGFALLQQHYGFIKMPGQFLVQAYPIIISWTDILWIIAGVAGIGYLIALLPVSRISKD